VRFHRLWYLLKCLSYILITLFRNLSLYFIFIGNTKNEIEAVIIFCLCKCCCLLSHVSYGQPLTTKQVHLSSYLCLRGRGYRSCCPMIVNAPLDLFFCLFVFLFQTIFSGKIYKKPAKIPNNSDSSFLCDLE
jgi:hypothetical protein